MRKSKYNSIKTAVDGITFESKKEAARYNQLKMLNNSGIISFLELQPAYDIVVNGKKICKYKGDFRYIEGGKTIVEDVKSPMTSKLPVYRLKKKLMLAVFDIEIKET